MTTTSPAKSGSVSISFSTDEYKMKMQQKFNDGLLFTKEVPQKSTPQMLMDELQDVFDSISGFILNSMETRECKMKILGSDRGYWFKRWGMKNSDCPTPHKKGFPTKGAANSAIKHMIKTARGKKIAQRSYKCNCDKWHLTSQPYDQSAKSDRESIYRDYAGKDNYRNIIKHIEHLYRKSYPDSDVFQKFSIDSLSYKGHKIVFTASFVGDKEFMFTVVSEDSYNGWSIAKFNWEDNFESLEQAEFELFDYMKSIPRYRARFNSLNK